MAKKTTAKKKTAAKKTTAAKGKTAAKAPQAKAPARASAKVEREVLPLAKVQPASEPRTKSEILGLLAETTGLSKKEVVSIFASLTELIEKDLSKKGCGIFSVPGLVKIRTNVKPATKARQGVNPFTGETQMFKAKPARSVVKIRPFKALKDMV